MKKICMVLVLCLTMMVAYGQADSKDTRIMVIKAIGVDEDIGGYLIPDSEYRAVTSIKAEVEFDEAGNRILKELVFSTKIFDASGEKVYTIECELEGGGIAVLPGWPCDVRNVMWTNVWFIIGPGLVKTTVVDESVLTNFPYRNELITLPNTDGEWAERFVGMMLSPNGAIADGEPWGGWAFAGTLLPSGKMFGGITWLRQFVEKWVR